MPVLDNKCMAFLPMSVGFSGPRWSILPSLHQNGSWTILVDGCGSSFASSSFAALMRSGWSESMSDLASPFLFGTFLKVDGNMTRWKSGSSGVSGTSAIGMIALVVGVLFQRVCRQRL